MTDLSIERLEQLKNTAWIGTRLVYDEVTDSTNTKAMRLAGQGAPHGTLVVADRQECGRGRRGRSWEQERGAAVAMSLLLREEELQISRAPMLTLVAALAVAEAIREVSGLGVQIKWPNDLIHDGRKVCGILTEMQPQTDGAAQIVVGIGINVNNRQFSPELTELATAMSAAGGREYDRAELIWAVCRQFEHFYGRFMQTQDLRAFTDDYNRCLVNRGRSVRVLDPQGAFEGIARGIAADGALEVETPEGVQKITSGEVSVRGVYGYV